MDTSDERAVPSEAVRIFVNGMAIVAVAYAVAIARLNLLPAGGCGLLGCPSCPGSHCPARGSHVAGASAPAAGFKLTHTPHWHGLTRECGDLSPDAEVDSLGNEESDAS